MTSSTDLGTTNNLPVNVSIPGYRLRYQSGSDAIGIWLDAEQESLGRKVTLKILKPEYEHHAGARKEFLAEMDRLSKLDHPDLLRIIDSQRDGLLLLVTERFSGRNLARELEPKKPLGEAASLECARSVGRALQYLTQQGLAHKNVSPRLIGLRDGGCRLTTFRNVVKMEELAALRGKLVQDARYVAPEQLAGEAPIGPATHTYQLACLLYHMLCGRPPHDADLPKEIAKAHYTEEFPSLKRLQPFLTGSFYELMTRATQRDPKERLPLDEMIEAMDAIADGRPPAFEGEAPKPAIQAPKPRRRRRRR